MDTDEVISEIGTAMENLLEKDVHGFTWDLENKVKKRVLICLLYTSPSPRDS